MVAPRPRQSIAALISSLEKRKFATLISFVGMYAARLLGGGGALGSKSPRERGDQAGMYAPSQPCEETNTRMHRTRSRPIE